MTTTLTVTEMSSRRWGG